jgi:hypothetical protein
MSTICFTEPIVANETDSLSEEISRKVLNRLGRPVGFHHVQAIKLWSSAAGVTRWRVNVWAKKGHNEDILITDSFFITTTGGEIIINIDRKY